MPNSGVKMPISKYQLIIHLASLCTVFPDNDPVLVIFKPFGKNPRIHSSGLETGWEPVLLNLVAQNMNRKLCFF